MAIVQTAPTFWFPAPDMLMNRNTGSFNATTLDSDTEYLVFYFVAPRTETLDRCEFHVASVTVSGNLKAQVYTVNTGTGEPDVSVGTEITLSVTTTGGKEITGLNASITAGNRYCLRFTVATGVNIAVNRAFSGSVVYCSFDAGTNTSGSHVGTAGSARGSILGLGTSAGYLTGYNPAFMGALTTVDTVQNINSSATNFSGNKFTFPFAGRLGGIAWHRTAGGTFNPVTAIAANAAGTILASVGMTRLVDAGDANGLVSSLFASPYDFAAGETVYIVIRADSAVNTATYYHTWRSADSIAGFYGSGICRVTATTLGTYTEDTDALAVVAPILTGFSDGAGGGGLASNPIRGFTA